MDAADFYTGIVVDAYARLKASSFDPQPYADFVDRAGQPALELGCGDGDPLLALRRRGLDVEGVDSSADMLEQCRVRAADAGVEVTLHHARMESLALGRRFGSIFLAGPTFTLLPDDATALAALRAIRAHLDDDGLALVPLWIPTPTPDDELGVSRESRDEAAGVALRYTALAETYDADARTRTTTTRYERTDASGTETVERAWVVHWHTRPGFTELCREAGLAVVDVDEVDDEELTVTLRRARGRADR